MAKEFEGKDLNEAKQAAADALGIPEPDLDYEIVEQGRRGLFGIGAKRVRIRIMPPIEPIREPAAARKAGRGRSRPGRAADDKRPPRGKKSGRSSTGRVVAATAGADGKPGADDEASREGKAPRRRERRPRRRGRRSGRRSGAEGGQTPKREASRPREPKPEVPAGPVTDEMIAVRDNLSHMFTLMEMEVAVEARSIVSGVALELSGADRKMLVRKDCELMLALQTLLNRMSRRTWPEVGRIQLACNGQGSDSGDGRDGRDDEVVELVNEVAQQVRRTGDAKQLHPMNAYERRLVHLTVRKRDGVASRSEGDGSMKRVTIFKE